MNLVLSNPPYSCGGNIIFDACRKVFPDATYSVLMPLSQYKKDDRASFVKSIEVAKNLFDADLTQNNCICVISKYCGKTYEDLFLATVDQDFIDWYTFNRKSNWKIIPKRCDNQLPESFDMDLDFIEGNRLPDRDTGISGEKGMGYQWNVNRNSDRWSSGIICIHFDTKLAKDAFTSFVYKNKQFYNRVLWGLHIKTAGEMLTYAIPQLDWNEVGKIEGWFDIGFDQISVLKSLMKE